MGLGAQRGLRNDLGKIPSEMSIWIRDGERRDTRCQRVDSGSVCKGRARKEGKQTEIGGDRKRWRGKERRGRR